jgi:homoserine kinase
MHAKMKIVHEKVSAYAPATVANVSCGFDIMGFAVDAIGDIATVSIHDKPHHAITMSGAYGYLIPSVWERNTVGAAVDAYMMAAGRSDVFFHIALQKNMPLGSGMGSSASSASAAVFAVNHLMGNLFSTAELIPFAMEGERLASGSAHADNVAPSLLGGFVLVRSYHPLDMIQIACPDDLFCAVVHPHVELHTADARRILKQEIPLRDVITQTANSAGLVAGLLTSDYALIGRSLHDVLAEPHRIRLIPGFEKARHAAMQCGALGCGISGSGPSVYALTKGKQVADEVAQAILHAFQQVGLSGEAFVSGLQAAGTRIVED